MDLYELKKEQLKLASKIILQDGFDKISTIGGAECIPVGSKLLACVVVCKFPSLQLKEKKTYLLDDPLPYHPEFLAYREMPAIIEAYNKLEEEPDVLLVTGPGIIHPRKIGIASHLGLALNKSTIGVQDKLIIGNVECGKITVNREIVGFEIKTKEHAKPIYVSPGYFISLGSVLNITLKTIVYPHKMPEPIHIARKIGVKIVKQMKGEADFSPIKVQEALS